MKENDRRTTMQWSRNIKPISYPKSKTNEEINSVNECRWQMIQNKKIRNAIAMLKMIVQAEEEIERGEVLPQEDVFAQLQINQNPLTGVRLDGDSY